MRDLVIVGAGGFARETAAAAALSWNVLGFADDDPALHGTLRSGLPILGPAEVVADLPNAFVVVCAGSPRDYGVRQRIVARLALPSFRYAVVTHPSAVVGAGSTIGAGTVLLAGAVLTADVVVGAHVAVMPQAVLTHDDQVHDYATIASGARLGGGVTLSAGSYAGAGALVREGVTIGAGSLIGMGSVVLRDVPPGEVWAGNPARHLRAAAPAPVPVSPPGPAPAPASFLRS